MNVLITGIDGFVGSHLVEALLDRPGIRMGGIVHPDSRSTHIDHLLSRVSIRRLDIADAGSVRDAILSDMPEQIYHLAGQAFVPLSMEKPYGTFQTNIVGTLNVLEAARELMKGSGKPCRVLVVSSGEVYGEVARSALPVHEEEALRPQNPYAVSKASADMIARQYRTSFGLPVVVARPFNHLGPRQSPLFVGSAFAKQIAEISLRKREPEIQVGNLEPRRDFTDVRDVVQAYIKILEGDRQHAVYNVCSGRSVRIGDLLEMFREASGVSVKIVPDPLRKRSQDVVEIVGDASRLRVETGWHPEIKLEQTVRDLLGYWKEQALRSA